MKLADAGVRIVGFRALLLHADSLVLDRWLWLGGRLPRTRAGERVIDIGCGNGAFSIGLGARGYKVLGLTWDAEAAETASGRAALCGTEDVRFEVQDVRQLSERKDLAGFDAALCLENIEHVLDDRRLVRSIADLLKEGGTLFLTAPNIRYRPVGGDEGPFASIEDGSHVRRGYSSSMIVELCEQANLRVDEIAFCGGFVSQMFTRVQRRRSLRGASPLRILNVLIPLIPVLDFLLGFLPWPPYSIGLVATKPRWGAGGTSKSAAR